MPKRIERQVAHIAASERRRGFSPKKARSIGWGFVIKHRLYIPRKRGKHKGR